MLVRNRRSLRRASDGLTEGGDARKSGALVDELEGGVGESVTAQHPERNRASAARRSIHPDGQRNTPLRGKRWCLFYISPPGLDDDYISQPLGIISIGAILKQYGIEVLCRDERIHSEEEMRAAIEWADVVGFSAMTPFVLRAVRWARIASSMPGGKIIMMGGPHTMMDPDLFLDTGDFHYVFSGEAEESLLEVIDADGDPERLRRILGISYKDVDGSKVINEKRPLIRDLDALPFPDHTLLPLAPYVERNPENLFYVFTSRGCPFTCVFCDKSLTGQTFRTRSAANIADELQELTDNFRPGNVLFIDELFTCQKKRVEAICSEIIDRNVKLNWACETRVDMVDHEMAEQMYRAGMRRIYFGAESGSDRMLATLHKQFTRRQLIETLKTMRRANVWTKIFLIIGTPGETSQDHDDTRSMLREAFPDAVRTSLFNPLPSTESFKIWYDRIDKSKILTTFVDSDDSPLNHENFTASELNEVRERIRNEHEEWARKPRQRLRRLYWRWRFYLLHPDLAGTRLVEKVARLLSGGRAPRRKRAPAGHARHLVGRWAEAMDSFRGEPTKEALERWERIRGASVRPSRRQLMGEPRAGGESDFP
jgi:radical SAM superfamily enzyme YgiQ (UPF0313 family)